MPKFSLGDYMDIIKVNGVAVEPSMIGIDWNPGIPQ